jgi:hypothetical protein
MRVTEMRGKPPGYWKNSDAGGLPSTHGLGAVPVFGEQHRVIGAEHVEHRLRGP